jgi:signal peptidase II
VQGQRREAARRPLNRPHATPPTPEVGPEPPAAPRAVEPGPPAPGAGSAVRNRAVFLGLAAVVLVADWVTKRMVAAAIPPHDVVRIVGDWVRLTYIKNPGAAFGLFPGSRPVLIAVSVAAVLIVVTVAWRRTTRLHTVLPLGLILGGAIGNLIDRVLAGQVVDFIQIGIPPDLYWPVFNVADSAVTIGVVWLAVGLVFWGREEGEVSEGGHGTAEGQGAPGSAAGRGPEWHAGPGPEGGPEEHAPEDEDAGPEEPPRAVAPSRDDR